MLLICESVTMPSGVALAETIGVVPPMTAVSATVRVMVGTAATGPRLRWCWSGAV